jgi:hypothetical protein
MQRQLYVLCNAGLANRLHAIAGAKHIAGQTGRQLKVWWPVNHHLGAPFKRLFENQFDFVLKDEIDALLTTENRVKVYNCGHDLEHTNVDEHYNVMGDDEDEIVVIKSWYIPKFKHVRHKSLMPYVVRFLRELEPVDEIKALVARNTWPAQHPVVGLHIRYSDFKPGDTTAWDDQITARYARSNVAAFVKCVHRIRSVPELSDTQFFVASPNPEIEKLFHHNYGAVYLPKTSLGRSSVLSMREAVADLLLLSRTRFILGSDYSQYSMMASELGCVPLVKVGMPGSDEQLEKLMLNLKQI